MQDCLAPAQVDDLPRLLIERLTDYAVIALDAEGHVRSWNAGAAAIHGYAADDVLGHHFSCFHTQEDIAAGKPARVLDETVRRGRYEETGLRRRHDGTTFHAHLVMVPIHAADNRTLLGFGEVTRDVSAEVIAKRKEKRLRRFVDVALDTMIDGVVVIDVHGRIQVCNRAGETMFGYEPGALIGRNVKVLMPSPVREAHDGYLKRYRETGQRSLVGTPREVTAQRQDGTTLPVRLAIGEAKHEGETIFVGVIHDLTERQAVEAELRQSQRLDAIGQLTGGVAHDFNNILMVIMASAESLADDLADVPSRPPDVAALERIIASTQRAADLTGQLLAFARRQPLKPQPTQLNDIVAATGHMIGRTLGEDIEIESILAEDLWLANVDRAQLEAALINLCVNARDAMPEGGRLMIQTCNVTLDEAYAQAHPDAPAGDYVVLSVGDTGTGIPAALRERIFEPFFTTKPHGKGTGLGLSMVYGFIRQSNGHIALDSEEGRGTTFRLHLPRLRAADAAALAVADSAAPPRGSERVLVVEDNAEVRRSVSANLRSLGYAVDEAADGTEALRLLADAPPYALLLSDVVMPGGLSGPALAAAARRQQPSLGVLFMSGYAHEGLARQGRPDEAVRPLAKPFGRIDLARAVRQAIDAAV